jgi:hypothetical protein
LEKKTQREETGTIKKKESVGVWAIAKAERVGWESSIPHDEPVQGQGDAGVAKRGRHGESAY